MFYVNKMPLPFTGRAFLKDATIVANYVPTKRPFISEMRLFTITVLGAMDAQSHLSKPGIKFEVFLQSVQINSIFVGILRGN